MRWLCNPTGDGGGASAGHLHVEASGVERGLLAGRIGARRHQARPARAHNKRMASRRNTVSDGTPCGVQDARASRLASGNTAGARSSGNIRGRSRHKTTCRRREAAFRDETGRVASRTRDGVHGALCVWHAGARQRHGAVRYLWRVAAPRVPWDPASCAVARVCV